MNKQAIILADAKTAPAIELIDSLTAGGISFVVNSLSEAEPTRGSTVRDGLVLLCEIGPGSSLDSLRAVVELAKANWPGVPLVACRRHATKPTWHVPDSRTLKTLGFRAIADNPAQLPALLRQVEDQSTTGELNLPSAFRDFRSDARLSFPRALRGQRLNRAFALLAALHLASDQKEAGQVALAGIAALVPADRWSIFLTTQTGGDDAAGFTPLISRSSERAATLPFEGEWQLELFDETYSAIEKESRTTREAAGRIEAIRKRENGQRVVALPLVNADRVIGVLEGIRDHAGARMFSQFEVSLLTPLAIPIAAALANSVRIAEAERLSLTDDLTKLHNARYLRQFLVNEIKRARRYHSKVAALFLDLDDFKRINDRHGHLVGSHALMEMASVILPSVRDTDCVVRYGGDEFVVILPETGSEEAMRVADRIRIKIEHHQFTGGRRLGLSLTASFGIAVFPQHALSPQQLVACADTAMYGAKAGGKNCIRLMSREVPSESPDRSESLAVPSLFQRLPDEKLIS